MGDVLNASAIHQNGQAKLQVGIRGDGFTLEKNDNVVKLRDLDGEYLDLKGKFELTDYAADSVPLMDGTAAFGSSNKYARMDHVHPSDTSRVPVYGKGINLLDNWYFAGGGSQQGGGQFPINQRAGYILTNTATYYTDSALSANPVTVSAYTTVYCPDVQPNYVGFYLTSDLSGTKYYASRTDCVPGYTGVGYGIDRWEVNTLILNNGYITNVGNSYLFQKFEPAVAESITGETITLSILFANGKLGAGTKEKNDWTPTAIYADSDVYAYVQTRSGTYSLVLWTSSGEANIKAVKLELGDKQTLAHQENGNWVLNDPPPNYQQELAKCQRYQYGIHFATEHLRTWECTEQNNLAYEVCFPVTLRATPTCDWSKFKMPFIRVPDNSDVFSPSGNVNTGLTNIIAGPHGAMLANSNTQINTVNVGGYAYTYRGGLDSNDFLLFDANL